MNIIEKALNEIQPYENNPRNNDEAVEYVANSIEEFGFKVPIIVDAAGVIVAGHTRYKAAIKLGLDKVPCIIADDLTDEQIKAFRLADNKVSEFSEWDMGKLAGELAEIGIDMTEFGFEDLEEQFEEEEEKYTNSVSAPQYEPVGETPALSELVDEEKANELLEEIEQSDLDEDEKEFLKKAAYRHLAFNYRSVAEYYAQASPEMQRLMEKSALVIIDYNDAIANGYTKLGKAIEEMRTEGNA